MGHLDLRLRQRRAARPHHEFAVARRQVRLLSAPSLAAILSSFCVFSFFSFLPFLFFCIVGCSGCRVLTGRGWRKCANRHTFFEGGVRVMSFISGPAVPPARRGTRWTGLAHSSDWCKRDSFHPPKVRVALLTRICTSQTTRSWRVWRAAKCRRTRGRARQTASTSGRRSLRTSRARGRRWCTRSRTSTPATVRAT